MMSSKTMHPASQESRLAVLWVLLEPVGLAGEPNQQREAGHTGELSQPAPLPAPPSSPPNVAEPLLLASLLGAAGNR